MPHDANRTRRQLIASAAGLVGAAAVARAVVATVRPDGGLLDAAGNPALSQTAQADSAAERLAIRPPPTTTTTTIPPGERFVFPPEGKIAFPLDPSDSCHLLDNYGDCRGERAHVGVDIMDERGRAVYAVADGRLITQYTNAVDIGAGLGWTLKADDERYFRYFHLDAFADGLEEGDEVSMGQLIGFVGATGTNDLVNNNHLHFEYYPEGPLRQGNSRDALPLLDLPDDISIGDPLHDCIGYIP